MPTPSGRNPAAKIANAQPKVNISPSQGWQLQTKVTTPAINHANHPTTPVKVGQLSQPDSYGRAMSRAYKATKTYGVPGSK